MNWNPRRKHFALIICLLLLGTSGGFFVGTHTEKQRVATLFQEAKQIRLPNEQYPLVNRLIGSELPSSLEFGIYTDLRDAIKKFADLQIKTTSLSKFSLYFRDLNTGLWFGVNENEEYIPASLFKLPLAMVYYKDSINDHTLLTKTYIYTAEIDSLLDTQIGLEKSELVVGNSYTIEELIKKMLIDSDNGAKNLLTEHLNVTTLNSLFNLIDLSRPAENNYYLSPKEYAFFLRILYNGTYIGQERSQTLLTMLSKTSFDQGIRKSIPADTTVIHKFGLITLADKETRLKQIGFRDCGIVYYPSRPFILCFMAAGADQQELVSVIEKVTAQIFKYIQNN